jgi:hypothetical protein
VVSDRRASLDEESEIKPAMRDLVEQEFKKGASLPLILSPDGGDCLASVPCLAARLHRQDVFFAGAVTSFAGDSRGHYVQSKLSLTSRSGRVTTETVIDELRVQHAP